MENLRIYPKRGFLNTEYHISSKQKEAFIVLFKDKQIYEGTTMPGETVILPKLKEAGDYTVVNSRTQERQKICVEDALRLGSSDLKKSYVFDDFPYIIFVMKDRIHFYDPIIGTYVFSENYLCPNDIHLIHDSKLLFATEHPRGTSLSVFDTERLSITSSIEVGKILAYSDNCSIIYVLNNNGIIQIINAESLSVFKEFNMEETETQQPYYVDKKNRLLHIVGIEFIYSIDMDTANVRGFNKKDILGITSSGFLISKNGKKFEYMELNPQSTIKGSFLYNPLAHEIKYNGFVLKNTELENSINQSKSKVDFIEISNEFIQECKAEVSSGATANSFSKDIDWEKIYSSVEFYPSKEGVYVKEIIERKYASVIQYYVSGDRTSSPYTEHSSRILWISNQGYEISYGNDLNFIEIDDEKASFSVNSSLYIMLKDGIIDSTHFSRIKLSEFSSIATEDTINLEGVEVICKSKNKLVCKQQEQYKYFEHSGNSEWREVKIIELKEKEHTFAKMSFDHKYLVYSKGGNQYALYNIEKQTEETVLTGNFVDFDKTGNLLFMEGRDGRPVTFRELLIYNPITFSWEKEKAQYYTFVSPDGKLYSKTALKTRYFNRITGKEISLKDYNKFNRDFNCFKDRKYSTEQKQDMVIKRTLFVENNKEYFESYYEAHKFSQGWIENILNVSDYPNFTGLFLYPKIRNYHPIHD